MSSRWRDRLADALLRRAAVRLGRAHPEWARAVLSEAEHLPRADRLRWAAGGWLASWRAPAAPGAGLHALALVGAVAAMTAYQWSVDEGPATLALACALTAALVLLRPSRMLAPVLGVGLVVFAVNLFGTLTGVRPAYETRPHTVAHDLRWTLMLAPVLSTAAAARWTSARLPPSTPGARP